MSSQAKYQYSPVRPLGRHSLNKQCRIRLLTLLPGSFAEAIVVRLKIVDLNIDQHPDYEALSYVWGSEKDPLPITIGRKWTLNISQNLDTALRHLRFKDKPREFWIDAICINQEDINERSQQVTLMGDIYRQARRVVVWLGPEKDNSTLALDFLDSLGRQVVYNPWTRSLRPTDWAESNGIWGIHQVISFPTMRTEYSALLSLFRRPWFQRVWIRQEIYLAKVAVIKCGEKEIPWETFRNSVTFLFEKPADYGEDKEAVEQGTEFNDLTEVIFGLCRVRSESARRVLAAARHAKCKDPRDKIYGMLSIYDTEHSRLKIVPDYTLPIEEVYRDFAVQCITRHDSLEILRSAGLERNIPGLPSWVPDWSTSGILSSVKAFQSVGGYLSTHAIFLGSQVLKVYGVVVSSIVELTTEPPWMTWEDIQAAIRDRFPSSKRCIDAYGGLTEVTEAYCRVLCYDNFNDRIFPGHDGQLFKDAMETLSAILRGDTNDRVYITDEEQKFLRNAAMYAKRICVTSQGRIGLVSRLAEKGDLICVFMGCPAAMILRPAAGHVGCYEIVGDGYLDGVMNGEALLGPLPEDIVPVWKRDNAFHEPTFLKTSNMRFLSEDPRLDSFPIPRPEGESSCWEEGKALLRKITPRMLRDRGVKLQEFHLR